MKKKGQAFLITAVILITVLVAFFTIVNYSKKTEFSKLEYISEQIQIESEKVMDYDLINPGTEIIDDFTGNISNNLDEDTEIYFITGESGLLICENSCDVSQGTDIIVTIENSTYKFPLFAEGKHFYYVMINEYGGEKYVYTN